jgi:hypothetical protein
MVVPWYISFYLSWLDCENKLLINYSDLIKVPDQVVRDIMHFSGVNLNRSEVTEAIHNTSSQKIRFNKGIEGRGNELSDEAREKIIELAQFYREYDLSPIGI